jgi:hypothetical protein
LNLPVAPLFDARKVDLPGSGAVTPNGGTIREVTMRPTWWLPGGHLQTIACGWWPVRDEPGDALRQVITLPDGDQLTVYANPPPGGVGRGDVGANLTVLLMPGLCGDHRSGLIRRLTTRLLADGVSVLRMNHRGCGEETILARRPYHAGRTEDLLAVIDWWRSCRLVGQPAAKLAICGISLSGNILLKTLGALGGKLPANVVAALAINPPIDLRHCVQQLSVGANVIYDRFFVRQLYRQLSRRKDETRWPDDLRRPRTLYEFDDVYTAPRSGFQGADDYYARSSAITTLGQIEVPTTVLTALDDPLIPVGLFTNGVAKWSDSTTVCIAQAGGHVGYFAARSAKESGFWMDEFVGAWVREVAAHGTVREWPDSDTREGV